MQNQFNIPFTKSFLLDNFEISIHYQVEGLVEMRYVWKNPNQKNIVLFQYIVCTTSFVTQSLKTSIISNAGCIS